MSESVRCSVLSNSATPRTVAFQPPVHEFLQARILKWVAFLFSPGDLPDPGIFLTQGSDSGLLHYRQIVYPLRHQGSTNDELLLLLLS